MASKAFFRINVTIFLVSVQQKSSGQETKFILFRLLVPFLFEAVRMVERGDAKPEVGVKTSAHSLAVAMAYDAKQEIDAQ